MRVVGIVLVFVLSVVAVLFFGFSKMILEADAATEEKVIVVRACHQLDISPANATIFPYAAGQHILEADGETYLLSVKKIGEKVISVKVIEKAEIAREK